MKKSQSGMWQTFRIHSKPGIWPTLSTTDGLRKLNFPKALCECYLDKHGEPAAIHQVKLYLRPIWEIYIDLPLSSPINHYFCATLSISEAHTPKTESCGHHKFLSVFCRLNICLIQVEQHGGL